jgi:hypothetical protein
MRSDTMSEHDGSTRRFPLSAFGPPDAAGVRRPPSAGAQAGYLDGAEGALLDALAGVGDRGTGSAELEPLMSDWASTYHLTPYRTTLFDAVGLHAAGDARVLELGAGCGAITRWLGEHCGEVHAVEGGPARAAVARARTADQDNVEVYSANFCELDETGSFDLVTLIGVLEYAHLYHPRHRGDVRRAAQDTLALAHDALADDGALVLAIENRLGLKYLNGAREDHSGRHFEGIEGYARTDAAVTFSRRELEGMLHAAGFGDVALLVPFPDYKLAHTIVNPDGARDEDHLHNWLAGPAPDRGGERIPLHFSETLAQRELATAGLLAELANSFLVIAYRGDRERTEARLGIDLGWTARHWSLDRRPGLRKRVTLRDGEVLHEPLDPSDASGDRAALARAGVEHAPAAEPFRSGDLVLLDVLSAVAAGGGDRLVALLRRHRAWLLEHFGEEPGSDRVTGAAWDAAWWNIVTDPQTGQWHAIDTEWRLREPVPVDYVVWRTVHHFVARHGAELPGSLRGVPAAQVAAEWLAAAGGGTDPAALQAYADLDTALGEAIAAGGTSAPPAAEPAPAADATEPARFSVLALADEVTAEPELLRSWASRFACGDPATLVLYAPDGDPDLVAAAIEAAIERAGLGADVPDLMLLPVPGGPETERTLLAQVAAVLSERAAPQPFASLPRFGTAESAALRELADAVWARG